MNAVITKTLFVQADCPKKLWLSRNKPDILEDTDNGHTQEGKEVGSLARLYFGPDFQLVSAKSRAQMAALTKALLQDPSNRIICEAAFEYQDLYAAADIVLRNDDGTLDVYEVKSSTHIKDIQLDDIGFQYHTITCAGYKVNKVHILHLNGDYVRGDELDIQSLFVSEECTDAILRLQMGITDRIERCRSILAQSEEPMCELSLLCEKPYVCPCKQYCYDLHEVPHPSVFDLAGVAAKKKYALWNIGCRTPEQMMENKTSFTELQMRQIRAMMATGDEADHIEPDKLQEFLSGITYPLYLLDFETFQCAIPRFKGTRPYEQIPFQYSIHWIEEEGGPIHHAEFLATEGTDPRRPLAESLCRDIPETGTTMAYNMKFEKSVLNTLSEQFPDLARMLKSMVVRMQDLMLPFQKKWYFTAAMHGSFSIKAVLPALCGNDPELDYHRLPVVHNGQEAMATYATLHLLENKDEVARIRDGLLLYCGLDTLAMVKVLEKIYFTVQTACAA